MPSASHRLAALVIAVAGCTSGGTAAPSGKVSLEFVSMSDSSVTIALVNGLDHAIYIRGASRGPSAAIDVMSADSEISCMTLPTSPESTPEAYTSLFGFVHGIGEWPYAEVPPKGRATLTIETKFPQHHRGSRCRLQLRLKDETVVGPAEFDP